MSSVDGTKSSPDKAPESFCDSENSKISYTRDFLLSLSGLDVCKKLPSGFDQSILSEFEDSSLGIQDRQRIPGSLPLQSSRHTEYGSSPPSRGDSSNYSRGVYVRWDNRSSGRSDRDSDLQSDHDSESARHHGNQSRRSWQSPEHDGLLGSGSFPRPSGAAGLSAPKVRSNDHYQLNRSNEPYHPPRPYKAVPYSRREITDSFNDETFGAAEYTSQDRAEEERKRRVSFELMRKEQQKALQEKQKLNPDKHKDGRISDITELLEDTKDATGVFNRSTELDESVTQPESNNDSSKSSLQTPAFRPLVPPGFRSTILERTSSSRSLIPSHSAEVVRLEIDESGSHPKAVVQNGTLDNQGDRHSIQKVDFREQQQENTSIHASSLNKGEQVVDSSADLEVSNKKLGVDNQLCLTSCLPEASEIPDGSEIIEFDAKKVTGHKTVSDSKQDHSTSILEKLFGSALTVNLNGSSGFAEQRDTERYDTGIPNDVQSSKFAQWFLEDEKKATEDPSYSIRSDLLSLIVGSEKGGSQVSNVKATQLIPPDLPLQTSELTNRHMTSSSTIGISEQFNNGKEEVLSAILTCEDLEQTILSEYSESTTLQAPAQGRSVSGAKTEEPKADIDDRASQHLMSLLHKGTGLKDITQPTDCESSDKLHVSKGAIAGTVLDKSRGGNAENIFHSGKTLTLETLFGSAFMKELQSVQAPVSIQRGPIGSERVGVLQQQGISFGDDLFPTSTSEIESNLSRQESNVLQSSQRQQTKLNKIENWFGFNDSQVEVDPSKQQIDVVSKISGFDGAIGIQLPEEESLITDSDPVNTLNSKFMSAGSLTEGELLSSNKPVDIVEKLAALNSVFMDERAMVSQHGPPFVRRLHDPTEPEIPYRNLHNHALPSSPRFHPPQMSHGRPFFRPRDSHPAHLNSQMNFMAPEAIIHHDAPAKHQFPVNMPRSQFHLPNTGPAGFERPHPHPMLQQMQTPGNFPLHHLLPEFPRGGPQPPHPSNQATGFMQELNPMQGFPFRQQQPNLSALGMPLSAPHVSEGNNHPDAFQRLVEMELRANPKQTHHLAAAGHSQGMYGHKLDMGFRYR